MSCFIASNLQNNFETFCIFADSTMRFDIITLHPGMLEGPFSHSILKRARERDLLQLQIHNLRDYAHNKHKQADDYAFGGGAGMVLMIEPIDLCISKLKSEREYDEVIYLSPDGELLTQPMANTFSLLNNVILLCGHYKGIDERVREHLITKEISVGSYVLTGGELGAAIIVDAVTRLIPGVLNDETSALTDTFQDGLVSPPVYTRPADYKGWKVPDVLLSGHQANIDEWRLEQSLERTRTRRPDILKS